MSIPPKRLHELIPVGGVSALIESDGGLLKVLPNHAVREGQPRRNRGAKIDQTWIVGIGQPMAGTDHGRKAGQNFGITTADIEEFHRLPRPEIRPRDCIVDIEALPALVQHRATHKVMPRHSGKQQCLEFIQDVRHDRGRHRRKGLPETQHERVVGDPGGHEIPTNPVEPQRIPAQDARRHRPGLAGRVHRRRHITAECGLGNFDYTDMHVEIRMRSSRTRPPPRGMVLPRSPRSSRRQTVRARSQGRPGVAGPARHPKSNDRAGFRPAPAS